MTTLLDAHGPTPAVYRRWTSEPAPGSADAWPDRVDVAVVGGGITGASAALHLAEGGASVALLEGREIGWGASGRAFGQVVPTLKHGNDRILAHFGPERGERLIDAIAAGPDLVFDLIARHGIDCGAVRTGLLFGAHTPAGARRLEGQAADWQRRGADVTMLDAAETESHIGSRTYDAACIDRRGGHLNPLGYVRGLARAAADAGAMIRTGTPVARLRREAGAWAVDAGGRTLRAGAVILATNAYTGGLWPALARSLVPMRIHGAAAEPHAAWRAALPGGHPLTDTRRLYSGVRRLPEGRLHVTVDGPAFGRDRAPFLASAAARIARLFGRDAGRPGWGEHWNGLIAVTPEQMPRMHALAPGLFTGYGYSGRGIAAATLVGRDLARLAGGGSDEDATFPLTPPRPIRGHAVAAAPIEALLRAWRVLDRIDEARHR